MDAEAAALGGRWVGRSVARVEDRRHLTGDATFVDDIRTAGVLHVAFARSPHGAARIEGIDTAEAAAAPGVHAVLTAADLGDLEPLVPRLNRPEFVAVEFPMLAAERVRHAGEPVAMVVADSPHAAEDAVELIVVDYEPDDAVALDRGGARGRRAARARAARVQRAARRARSPTTPSSTRCWPTRSSSSRRSSPPAA